MVFFPCNVDKKFAALHQQMHNFFLSNLSYSTEYSYMFRPTSYLLQGTKSKQYCTKLFYTLSTVYGGG
jgi:hypothetical protein